MRKFENLYAGLSRKTLIGEIDIDWARKHKERFCEIVHKGEIVLYVNLDVLLHSCEEKVNGKEKTAKTESKGKIALS